MAKNIMEMDNSDSGGEGTVMSNRNWDDVPNVDCGEEKEHERIGNWLLKPVDRIKPFAYAYSGHLNIRATDLGSCPRSIALDMLKHEAEKLDFEKDEEKRISAKWATEVGSMTHEKVQDILARNVVDPKGAPITASPDNLILLQKEVYCTHRDLEISGFIDAVVWDGEQAVPFELKTLKPNAITTKNFMSEPGAGDSPIRKHLYQIQNYMWATNAPYGYLCYVNKGGRILEKQDKGYMIELPDAFGYKVYPSTEIRKDIVATAKAIHTTVPFGKAPPMPEGADRKHGICFFCRHKKACGELK